MIMVRGASREAGRRTRMLPGLLLESGGRVGGGGNSAPPPPVLWTY